MNPDSGREKKKEEENTKRCVDGKSRSLVWGSGRRTESGRINLEIKNQKAESLDTREQRTFKVLAIMVVVTS